MTITCPELLGKKRSDGGYRLRSEAEIRHLSRSANERTDLLKYQRLHRDGRRLISGWFEKATAEQHCEPEDCFEPFVFAFIALNAWASCVTGHDGDRDWREALALNRAVGDEFHRLVIDPSSPVSAPAEEFRRLWPVFEVQRLRRQGVDVRYEGEPLTREDRREVVGSYLGHPNADALRFEPQCWRRHRDSGEKVPLDWPHTLAALYRVRCNLFHGEKARHSEMDQRIVASGFRVLIQFLDNTDYLRPGLRNRRKT